MPVMEGTTADKILIGLGIVALAVIASMSIIYNRYVEVVVNAVVGAIVFLITRQYYQGKIAKIMKKEDGHEFRFAYMAFFLAGAYMGILDAAVLDFTSKFFIGVGLTYFLLAFAVYEMLSMGKPRNLLLSAVILLGVGTFGYIGAWHLSWAITWILVHGPLPDPLWLAPNIYAPLELYTGLTGAMLLTYIAVGLLINFSKAAKKLYTPPAR